MATLSDGAKAAQERIRDPYYGLVYLALATLCYLDEKDADKSVAQRIIDDVAGGCLKPLPAAKAGQAPLTGYWAIEWGPVVLDKNANLMFVISFRECADLSNRDPSSDPPVFVAVCLRGTDIRSSISGDSKQFIEDLDAHSMVLWSTSITGDCTSSTVSASDPMISHGTCAGLKLFVTTSGAPPAGGAETTVAEFVTGFLEAWPDTPVVVTGHSLGGCQTTVMALYLKQLESLKGATVCPNPFAPPTAGNGAFADAFNAAFAADDITANLWWNDMDVVPQAFISADQGASGDGEKIPSLQHVKEMWETVPCPEVIRGVVTTIIDLTQENGFQHPILDLPSDQPGAARNHRLTGPVGNADDLAAFAEQFSFPDEVCPGSRAWLDQLVYQHFPPVYYQRMKDQVADLADYPYLFAELGRA